MFILWSDGADTTLKCFIPCLFYDLMVLMRRWSVLYHVYSMIWWCWYDVEVFYTMFILWSDGADTMLKCFIPCLFYDLMALMRRWSVLYHVYSMIWWRWCDVEVHVPHQESESSYVVVITIFPSIFDYSMGFRKCSESVVFLFSFYCCIFITVFGYLCSTSTSSIF